MSYRFRSKSCLSLLALPAGLAFMFLSAARASAIDQYSYWYGFVIGGAGVGCEQLKNGLWTHEMTDTFMKALFDNLATADREAVNDAKSFLRDRYRRCPL